MLHRFDENLFCKNRFCNNRFCGNRLLQKSVTQRSDLVKSVLQKSAREKSVFRKSFFWEIAFWKKSALGEKSVLGERFVMFLRLNLRSNVGTCKCFSIIIIRQSTIRSGRFTFGDTRFLKHKIFDRVTRDELRWVAIFSTFRFPLKRAQLLISPTPSIESATGCGHKKLPNAELKKLTERLFARRVAHISN